MNILIAATHLKRSNGGVCTHVVDLCKALTKTEKVVLVANGTDYNAEIESIPELTYVELPFENLEQSKKAIFKCYNQLRQLCKEHHIEIIHLHGQRLIPVAWLLRVTMGIPFLWTNHIDAIPRPKLLAKMWSIMRFPIISVSTELKSELVDKYGVDEKKITVVNNGVDLTTLQPLSDEEKLEIRNRFGVKPDTFVISEVARLTHIKGQHFLVRAVHALNQKNIGVKLQVLLAGSGDIEWFQKNVLDYAQENDVDCKYLGFCKPREVYGVSDLAVLPSIYEGFSLSSTEALAVGCPVLRSDTPGYIDMKDFVLACKKNDQENLTTQLEYAITHAEEMRAMAEKGLMLLPQRFTKEIMTQETLEVYRRVVGIGK